MNNIALRWLLWPISLMVQILVYILYPVAVLFYRKKIKPNGPSKLRIIPQHHSLSAVANKWSKDPTRNSFFLNDQDDHTGLTHAFYWNYEKVAGRHALHSLVTPEGSLYRRYPDMSHERVSGDCLSTWTFGNVLTDKKNEAEKVALHYLKNCFGLKTLFGYVSTKSSNGGMTQVRDGAFKLNPPAFGPQYYTSAGIFALAASQAQGYKKTLWNLVYKLNYALYGGWLWKHEPVLHTWTKDPISLNLLVKKINIKPDSIYYAQHITMLNLYSLCKLRGSSEEFLAPMKKLVFGFSPNINPLFYALYIDAGGENTVEGWNLARDTLLGFKQYYGFVWQRAPYGDYFEQKEEDKFWSPGSYVADLLLKNRPKGVLTREEFGS